VTVGRPTIDPRGHVDMSVDRARPIPATPITTAGAAHPPTVRTSDEGYSWWRERVAPPAKTHAATRGQQVIVTTARGRLSSGRQHLYAVTPFRSIWSPRRLHVPAIGRERASRTAVRHEGGCGRPVERRIWLPYDGRGERIKRGGRLHGRHRVPGLSDAHHRTDDMDQGRLIWRCLRNGRHRVVCVSVTRPLHTRQAVRASIQIQIADTMRAKVHFLIPVGADLSAWQALGEPRHAIKRGTRSLIGELHLPSARVCRQ